jgi:hypothetical protein
MRRSRLLLSAVAVTATAATAGLTLGSAFASTSPTTPSASATPAAAKAGKQAPDVKLPKNPTLAQVQAAAATDIANRVTVLNTAIAKVQAAKDLGGDQATLVTSLQGDIAGLQQLGTSIAGDTTLAAAETAYKQIFTNFRIYALAVPATRLVVADDRLLNTTGPALTKRAARIAAKETPANQAVVQPLLADLATQVTAANTALSGQPAALEAFTPAAWNSNHKLLGTSRADTKTALSDLAKARSDAKQAAAAVRR